VSGTTERPRPDDRTPSGQEEWRWGGTQFTRSGADSPGTVPRRDHIQVRRPPSRANRVRSGCTSLVLYFPFYLLLVFLVLPIRGLLGEAVSDFVLSLDGAAALYFLFVIVPLTIFFGQSIGQMVYGIYVVRSGRSEILPPQRAGPLRSVAHLALFVVLFPIDWLPWVFGRTRMLHELVAGTEVLISPSPVEVRLTARGWLTLVGVLYFGYTILLLAAGWGQTATYVTVAVMWAIPIGVGLWVATAERHPLFLALSFGLICIGGPIPILWAVLTGKIELDFINTIKLWLLALFVMWFGFGGLYYQFKRRKRAKGPIARY
jgi:uncharacterized RDD family membrane protein YckC